MTQQTIERVDEVLNMLGNMVPRTKIISALANNWDCKPSAVKRYLAMAQEILSAPTRDPNYVNSRRDQMRLSLETCYMAAMSRKDIRVAISAIKELGQLDGCYQQKLEIDSNAVATPSKVSFNFGMLGFKNADEVRGRIAELKQRMTDGGAEAVLATKVIDVEEVEEADEDS